MIPVAATGAVSILCMQCHLFWCLDVKVLATVICKTVSDMEKCVIGSLPTEPNLNADKIPSQPCQQYLLLNSLLTLAIALELEKELKPLGCLQEYLLF